MLLAGCVAPLENDQDNDMANRHLPKVMRPVPASQIVADARSSSGHTNGYLSLQTNRGQTIDYTIVSGIAPPPVKIVSDSGESVHGDGLSWIVTVPEPQLVSGVYDPGLAIAIQFGTGGGRVGTDFANSSLILNLFPGFEVVVPADSIDVFVISTSNPPVALDSVTKVTALLHRATPSGHEGAHRSFVVPAAQNTNIAVPSFAKDMAIYGNEVGAPGAGAAIFDNTALLSILLGNSGVPPITYKGSTLLSMFRAGQRIELPGNATQINMTYPHILVDSFLLDFGF